MSNSPTLPGRLSYRQEFLAIWQAANLSFCADPGDTFLVVSADTSVPFPLSSKCGDEPGPAAVHASRLALVDAPPERTSGSLL
ncbi:MAG: hypothetical protein F6K42_26140 [Leptolyngbya sp. SIO1D8]|nr:hypothetical protein [Leptolyngbya sp. SIO1D8]